MTSQKMAATETKRFLTMKSLVPSTSASVKKVSFSSHPKTKIVVWGTQMFLEHSPRKVDEFHLHLAFHIALHSAKVLIPTRTCNHIFFGRLWWYVRQVNQAMVCILARCNQAKTLFKRSNKNDILPKPI